MAPQVLKLQEIEPPHELAAALSDDFLGKLSIANPPPVQIAILEQWGGYCHRKESTEKGEVIIADWRSPASKVRILERIREVYIHESSHRLIWQIDSSAGSHGVEFFALQLFLFFRAGKSEEGRWPMWTSASLYDCLNCLGEESLITVGQSIDWAWETAQGLASQEITAEAAAEEICRRVKKWKAWKAEEPARRSAALEKQKATRAALTAARDKIFWWRFYFGSASFMAAAFLILAISMR